MVHGVRRSGDFYRDIDMHGKNILNAGNLGINIGELMKGTNKNVVSEGTLIEGFETIADWDIWGIGATQEATTNCKQGTYALKLNAVNGNSATSEKTINEDFSAVTNFIIWVYIEDITKLLRCMLLIGSTANWSKHFSIILATWNFHSGWNRLVIDKAKFTAVGGDDWANTMIRIRVRVYPTAGKNIYAIFDDLRKDYIARPKVIITFDDNNQTVYDKAYPIMDANNQKGVLFVVPSWVGTPWRMTTSTINNLYNVGWDVSNHTQTHQDLTAIPEAEMHTEIDDATTWLVNNGFKSSSLLFAYPYGEYNQTVIDYLKTKNFVFARSTRGLELLPQLNLSDDIAYQIGCFNCGSTTLVADIKTYIDEVIVQGGLLVLLFHVIVDALTGPATEFLTADFQEISDYLKTKSDANLLDVETFTNYMWEFLC